MNFSTSDLMPHPICTPTLNPWAMLSEKVPNGLSRCCTKRRIGAHGLLVWQWLRPLGTFARDATHFWIVVQHRQPEKLGHNIYIVTCQAINDQLYTGWQQLHSYTGTKTVAVRVVRIVMCHCFRTTVVGMLGNTCYFDIFNSTFSDCCCDIIIQEYLVKVCV